MPSLLQQLSFFRKAVKSLESIEPHVRLVAEQQHIDYQFSGLKDDELEIYGDDETDSDEDDDTEDDSETNDDGELSFEHGQNGPTQEASTLKHPMEVTYFLLLTQGYSYEMEFLINYHHSPLF